MVSKLNLDSTRMESVVRWLAVAMKDRHDANALLGVASLENAAYHLQQSSEKMLKAYLVANGQEAPKTHNIDKLILSAVLIDPTIAKIHTIGVGSERMTDFATYYRYPNPDKNDIASIEELNGAIEFVNETHAYLKDFFDDTIWNNALKHARLQENPFVTTLLADNQGRPKIKP